MLPLLGVALLLLLFVDVFRTVFLPQGHGGPLSRRMYQLIWGAFRKLGTRGGRARVAWLRLGGPTLALLTPAVWASLLVVGYALIFLPWIDTFLASPGRLGQGWVESLYYSGYSAATLGLGDMVATLPALRILTVVEAFSGFALVTASLSYVLVVYREQGIVAALALDVCTHLPDGADTVPRSGDPHHLQAWARWMEGVARSLLHVTQAHSQYPVLHYFRPIDPTKSLPVQAGALVELRRRLGDPAPDAGPAILVSYPGWRALFNAVEEYVSTVDSGFVPENDDCEDYSDQGELERAHGRMLRYMGYI